MPILRKKFNEEYWMAKESLILALGAISRGCASGMADELPKLLDTNLRQKPFLSLLFILSKSLALLQRLVRDIRRGVSYSSNILRGEIVIVCDF